MTKQIRLLFLIFISVTLMVSLVSAYGISTPYRQGKPLELSPGGSEEVMLNLQNFAGDEDTKFIIDVVEGKDLVRFRQTEFIVSSKSEIFEPFTVSVSRRANVGDVFPILINVRPSAIAGEGGITLGVKLIRSFDVVVVEPPVQPAPPVGNATTLAVVVAIIISLWVIVSYLRKKKFI
ncbi:hypothetical protein ACFLZZ_02700 [Nanoarchaeota archaeon]